MTTAETVFLVGRILLGGYFLLGGINHFRNAKAMAGYAQHKGVPAPKIAVLGTGTLLALGGASILTGFLPWVGIALLSVFLLGVTPKMHDFWNVQDPMARMGELVNFQKNVALLGALLALAVVARPWPIALA